MKEKLKIKNNNYTSLYDILIKFSYNNNNYLVYTDNKYNNLNELNIYASILKDGKLYSVQTNEEWNLIDKKLMEIGL